MRRVLQRGLSILGLALAHLPGAGAGPGDMASAVPPAPRPMVISIDDGPSLAPMPPWTPEQRHRQLREALAAHRATAVMYVTLGFGAAQPAGLALARQWVEAGHLLGNHTITHLDIDDERQPLQRTFDEIQACDAAMNALPGWRRWYRAPYLHEGRTRARRDGLRRFLQAEGYRLAPVHLDSRDWQFAPRLAQALQGASPSDAAAVQAEFLTQLFERALALPPQPGGAPAVLLIHDTLMTAMLIEPLLRGLEAQGFVFVHPDTAMHSELPARPAAPPDPSEPTPMEPS